MRKCSFGGKKGVKSILLVEKSVLLVENEFLKLNGTNGFRAIFSTQRISKRFKEYTSPARWLRACEKKSKVNTKEAAKRLEILYPI